MREHDICLWYSDIIKNVTNNNNARKAHFNCIIIIIMILSCLCSCCPICILKRKLSAYNDTSNVLRKFQIRSSWAILFSEINVELSYSLTTLILQDVPCDPISAHVEAPKAIVFLSSLMSLFSVCQVVGCNGLIDPANRSVTQHGAAIVVQYTCNNHHSGRWCSSPTVGQGNSKVYVINSVLASYSLTCGLHISQVTNYSIING